MSFRIILLLLTFFGLSSTSFGDDLFDAVSDGDLKLVKHLLESGSNANMTNKSGITPISYAYDLDVIDLLLSHGANPNVPKTQSDRSVIEYMAERYGEARCELRARCKEIVEKLRTAGADYSFYTALCMDDVEFVRHKFTKKTFRVNAPIDRLFVPLRVAARAGSVEVCKLLLELGADPDSFESYYGFPIMVDAVRHPPIVKLLIEHGANLRQRITFSGRRSGYWIVQNEASPLHYAVKQGNVESVKLLVSAGVDPNAATVGGQTPLHIAVTCVRWEADLCAADDPPRSIASAFEEIIRYLLENDASIRFTDKEGRTPLKLAEKLECPESICQLLRDKEESGLR